MIWIALVGGSYLLGSVSWSVLIVRWRDAIDVRNVGSGNAGATNVLRVSGTWPALAALVLDAGKGTAAVVAAFALGAPDPVSGGAALAVVLGHVFPVFHAFHGGKGVATALGAFVVLTPLPAALAALVFLVVTLATRYVSLGSMSAVLILAPLGYLCSEAGWSEKAVPWHLAVEIAVAVVILCKHRDNIRRLRDGVEAKLGPPRREEAI